MFFGEEFRRLLERTAQHENDRHDQAADQERDAPAPGQQLLGAQGAIDPIADQRRDEHGGLLAGGLERRGEALASRLGDFGEVDRDAPEFDARRKALQQPAEHDDDRRGEADRRIARREGDDDGAGRHDRQCDDQPFAAADAVDIGAEKNRAERAHRGAEPEHHESDRGVGEFVTGGEKRLADRRRVEPEQEEVEHFEEIARRGAQHGAEFRLGARGLRHFGRPSGARAQRALRARR